MNQYRQKLRVLVTEAINRIVEKGTQQTECDYNRPGDCRVSAETGARGHCVSMFGFRSFCATPAKIAEQLVAELSGKKYPEAQRFEGPYLNFRLDKQAVTLECCKRSNFAKAHIRDYGYACREKGYGRVFLPQHE